MILIDSSNLAFRCHYVNQMFDPRSKTRKPFEYNGHITSAIFGFYKNLIMLRRANPGRPMVCVFDSRNEDKHALVKQAQTDGVLDASEGYKGTRNRTSSDYALVIEQLDELRATLSFVCNLQVVKIDRQEADDIIGSYAVQYPGTIIVSGDGDFQQLVNEKTTILDGMKGIQVTVESLQSSGITPLQAIDVGALQGDTSDNIPGLPGIGEKTALKLVQTYGNLEDMIEKLAAKTKLNKAEATVLQFKEKALVCKKLKAIRTDLPVPAPSFGPGDRAQLTALFQDRWGFKSLIPQLDILCT